MFDKKTKNPNIFEMDRFQTQFRKGKDRNRIKPALKTSIIFGLEHMGMGQTQQTN